jgi:hypothetical protein
MMTSDCCVLRHSDVVRGSVVYIQTDLGAATDDLEFTVQDVQNVISGLKVKVVVKPRLNKPDEPIRVDSASRGPTVIGLNYLDASELKVSTSSMQLFCRHESPGA